MPLSLSQEDNDNVVLNRPLPAKPTGAQAVAAFRPGQTSAKKSKLTDVTTSASKDTDKKIRKSIVPTSTPHSPASLPSSPPPSGSGRKRKVSVVEAERKEDANEEENENEAVSPLDAALIDFVPVSLTPLPPTTQPLWLFQFPAKFDVAAFSALRLSLPTVKSAGAAGRIISRFQLGDNHYRILEAESTDTTDIVNLFPASTSSTANLTPGRPFTRVLRITLDEPNPHTASWQHTAAALHRKTRVPPARGLTVHFRPIGYMAHTRGQEVGERRGRGFQKVGYEAAQEDGKEGREDREERRDKERKRRKKEQRGKENDEVAAAPEGVSEKKKKKKDKDKHRDSK